MLVDADATRRIDNREVGDRPIAIQELGTLGIGLLLLFVLFPFFFVSSLVLIVSDCPVKASFFLVNLDQTMKGT